jgi:hypothetical protein
MADDRKSQCGFSSVNRVRLWGLEDPLPQRKKSLKAGRDCVSG